MKKLSFFLLLITLFSFKLTDQRSIYHLPMQAGVVSAIDYDLDGDKDLVVNHGIEEQTQWGGIYMLQNDANGYFTFMDSIYDTVRWINRTDTVLSKSYPDILYYFHDTLTILSNDGINYTKSHFYIGPQVNDFELGDIDNNDHLDIVFISNLNRYWGVIYNEGDGSFSEPKYYDLDYPPIGIACKNLNDDRRDDVLITGWGSEVYFSTEDGFEKQALQHFSGYGQIDDLDNDGDNDIITMSETPSVSQVRMYENLGDNVFDTISDFLIPQGCSDFRISDFNNDSLPDMLFLTHAFGLHSGYYLYYNKGGFEMSEPQFILLEYYGEMRRFMYCADMDGNGYNDIITSRQVFDIDFDSSPLEILFNDGKGNFVDNPLTDVRVPYSIGNNIDLSCYPNPFTEQTNIEFKLYQECNANLGIYSLNGNKIKTLTDNKLKAGEHKTIWDGTDEKGKEVNTGIYIIRLVAGMHTFSCRLMYIK